MARGDSFDLDAAKLILSDLAKFHGTTIGLKLKHPKLFDNKIKASCATFNFYAEQLKRWLVPMRKIIQENPQCTPFIETATSFFKKKASAPREPYATITHCDLWVNNTMQIMKNSKVIKNVFVDFQICDYRSCASDIFFFLWTSVQQSVLVEHLDNLIEYYHNQLLSTLKELKCDTSAFSVEKFYDELKIEANFEFGHAFLFAFASKNPALSMTNPEQNNKAANSEESSKQVPDSLKELLWFMIIECNKRGWLY